MTEPTTVQHAACATISSRSSLADAAAVVRTAHRLGVTGLRAAVRHDLAFVAGPFTDGHLDVLGRRLLADPLLHELSWHRPATPPGAVVVEVTFLPGVTDTVAGELVQAAALVGVPVTAAATGVRWELHGELTTQDVARLAARVLANPVIERWVVGEFAAAAVLPDGWAGGHDRGHHGGTVTVVPVRSLSATELAALGAERALALDAAELAAVQAHFVTVGRDPTDAELETLAQTWSEHCSHKSFRAQVMAPDGERPSLLHRLRRSTEAIDASFVVSAFDGNAGIVRFGPGLQLALKVETHNHPSAVEPFGGANTGVGGVIRDVMAAPAWPVAATDVLCFGPLDLPAADLPDGSLHPAQVAEGVVAGVGDYGNKIGVPTVAGAVLHHEGYTANPLVFCGCIGLVPDDTSWLVGPQSGDRVLVLGGRTGRDGIKGATFSSAGMDATTGDVAGASVQIGDPIVQKRVVDALEELHGAYHAITDCGAGGLSSAVGEMAEHLGADVDMALVPRKYPGLTGWEVWLSEAQERMVLAVSPARVTQVAQVCARHGVEWADLGAFTGDGRLLVRHHHDVLVDLPTAFLHGGRPTRTLPTAALAPARGEPGVRHVAEPTEVLLALLAHPTIASKESVVRRFDHEVQGRTVVRPCTGAADDGPADGVVLAHPGASAGFAVGIGVNPWFGAVDPERMAEAVVDEAIRNAVVAGADPDAVALLDNFSWGDPTDPATFAALEAAVDGCVRAARRHRAPFVSGKDSLNNTYLDRSGRRRAVPPTLVIHAVGHVPDAWAATTPDLKAHGNLLVLLGASAPVGFGGSHLDLVAPHARPEGAPLGCVPPVGDEVPVRYRGLHRAIRAGIVQSAHDVSEGGLAVALAEMCMAGRLGAAVEPPDGDVAEVTAWLFGEACGRVLVEVAMRDLQDLEDAVGEEVTLLGRVTRTPALRIGSLVDCPVSVLLAAWQGAAGVPS